MSTGIAWVLGIVITGLLVAVGVWALRRRERKDLASLSEEQQQRHFQCLAADRELREAEREYKRRVDSADYQLGKAKTPKVLSSVSSVSLTELDLTMNGRTYPLDPRVRVRVDSSGGVSMYVMNSKTIGNADTRELYLTVSGSGWEESIRLDPAYSELARRFAAEVHTAAQHVAEHATAYRSRLADAERNHVAAVAETARLESAKHARLVLETDPLADFRLARKEAKRAQRLAPKSCSGPDSSSATRFENLPQNPESSNPT